MNMHHNHHEFMKPSNNIDKDLKDAVMSWLMTDDGTKTESTTMVMDMDMSHAGMDMTHMHMDMPNHGMSMSFHFGHLETILFDFWKSKTVFGKHFV